MCDEHTLKDAGSALARRGLSRRQFALAGTAAVLASCASADDGASGLGEALVTVPTPDGEADGFFVHPPGGPYPGVVMWPDIAGLRDAMKAMARRLAAAGYAVLAVNQYYRSAPAPVLNSLADYFGAEGQAKIKPMREAITPAGTMRDAAAFIAFLDRQEAVDKTRRIGTNGYCAGGPYAVRTAAAVPERVGAAASMHGAWLTTEEPDSPHRLIKDTRASFLFAIGQNDDARAPGDKALLRQAAEAAGRPAEIEVYPADHGWCVPDAPIYDKAQADRAFARILALFERAL